jgi:DNA-binding response OmpR family regulator
MSSTVPSDANFNHIVFYILIVDDDKDDHFFLRKAISKTIPQAIIESLYDGSEAISFLDDCTALPNLIFLDLNMTKISGRNTIIHIRKNKNLSNVPVIVLTTSKNEDEKIDALKLGANDFYTKPDDPATLVTIVESVKTKWLF